MHVYVCVCAYIEAFAPVLSNIQKTFIYSLNKYFYIRLGVMYINGSTIRVLGQNERSTDIMWTSSLAQYYSLECWKPLQPLSNYRAQLPSKRNLGIHFVNH